MHRIKVLSGILVLTALLGSAMIVAPAAQASGPGAGEAYYLFYRVIKDIHKSCPGNVPGYFIKDAGPANLRPYRKYRTVSAGVTKGGSFQTLKWWEDAFSTADRQEWCYKGDFVLQILRRAQSAEADRTELFLRLTRLSIPVYPLRAMEKRQLVVGHGRPAWLI